MRVTRSKVKTQGQSCIISLLFKANEQHADIPITAPRTMRSLPSADRPYEFADIIKKNHEFFTAMHAIL